MSKYTLRPNRAICIGDGGGWPERPKKAKNHKMSIKEWRKRKQEQKKIKQWKDKLYGCAWR